MARGQLKLKRKKIAPDKKYQSVDLSKFINKTMLHGKKSKTTELVYKALEEAGKKLKKNPDEVFENALKESAPLIEVRSKRIGGAAYQIPVQVNPERGKHLAMKWIIDAARARKGASFDKKLAAEIIDLLSGTGGASKKKEDTHKMAEANKALAYLAKMR